MVNSMLTVVNEQGQQGRLMRMPGVEACHVRLLRNVSCSYFSLIAAALIRGIPLLSFWV